MTMTWNTTPTTQWLAQAYNVASGRMGLDRYRSRTTVTTEDIYTAFSFIYLPKVNEEAHTLETTRQRTKYTTQALPRGVDVETAMGTADQILRAPMNYAWDFRTFNTATNAEATEALMTKLTQDPEFEELDVRTFVTATPNHKIHIYKSNLGYKYIILNNLDTKDVVFRIAAAVILNSNILGDKTQELATAWLSQDTHTIENLLHEKYDSFEQEQRQRKLQEAVEMVKTQILNVDEQPFIRRITDVECEIQELYATIHDKIELINSLKAQLLAKKLEPTDAAADEFEQFINSCADKITDMSISGKRVYMVVKQPLTFFEPESVQRYFDSTRPNTVTNAAPVIQKLVKDIFINKTYELLLETGFYIDLNSNVVEYISETSITRACLTGIPNPHHRYYNCWGNNEPEIRHALEQKQYTIALAQIFAALGGINATDSAVFQKLLNNEFQDYTYMSYNCLTNRETNEIISISEYIRRNS